MPIARLQMKEFSAIESADLELVDGLNVFIGANGTGKTHVMKLLYSVLQYMPGEVFAAIRAGGRVPP